MELGVKAQVLVVFFSMVALLPGCQSDYYYQQRQKKLLQKTFVEHALPEGPLTVFIHGTKASMLSRSVHQLDYRRGILALSANTTNSVLSRIGYILTETDPVAFPRESFYFYSWPGQLTFPDRLRAAEQLYEILKNHSGPLTIITHSHGSNVALNLASVAKACNDTTFKVDKLIMLAPPVQEVTKPFVNEPLFKEVYNFYSSSDIFQVGDVQALYWESYACTPPHTRIPFLSKRTFPAAPHIMQARILLDWQSPNHLQFMLARFIKKLPLLMKLIKNAAEADGFTCKKNKYIINIPPCNMPPHIVELEEIQCHYSPRSTYHRTKRMQIQQDVCTYSKNDMLSESEGTNHMDSTTCTSRLLTCPSKRTQRIASSRENQCCAIK